MRIPTRDFQRHDGNFVWYATTQGSSLIRYGQIQYCCCESCKEYLMDLGSRLFLEKEIWDSNMTMITRWRRDATKLKKRLYLYSPFCFLLLERKRSLGSRIGRNQSRKSIKGLWSIVTKRSLHFSWRSPLRKTYWSLSSNYQRSDLSSHENDLGNAALGGEISLF